MPRLLGNRLCGLMGTVALATVSLLLTGAAVQAEAVRIVSWNASPTLYEGLDRRLEQIRKLSDDLKADVLVLVEVTGEYEARKIAAALGWPEYHAIVPIGRR
jgi:hypothetical protein